MAQSISLDSDFKNESNSITFDVQIYSNKNQLVFEDSGVSSPYKVDASKLKSGKYIVHAIIGETVIHEHLIIE